MTRIAWLPLIKQEAGEKTTRRREVERVELEALQPSCQERRWFHGIALFYFVVAAVFGMPLWWLTTSPEQFALPAQRIEAFARQAITVGVDVSSPTFCDGEIS